MWAAWIGPAIVAAVISATVTGIGWFVSERQTGRREIARRRERIADVQTALLAEIRAGRHRIGTLADLRERLNASPLNKPGYEPFVTRPVATFVLHAIMPDLHLLPSTMIDPIVLYYRQLAAIALFVDDLRSDRFSSVGADQKRDMYENYIDLLVYTDGLAAEAEDAISRSQNRSGEVRSGRLSDEEPDAASGRSPLQSPHNTPGTPGSTQDSTEPRA